jgi:hypothetical protein
VRVLMTLLVGTALVAGCNAADRPANESANGPAVANVAAKPSATANAAQPAQVKLDQIEFEPAPQAASAPDPRLVTRAWFAGRWTDSGDCAQAGNFAANGTYLLADGTRGMWNIIDGKLVVQHAGGRSSVGIRKVDEDAVEVVSEDGSVGRSIRC